MILTGGQIVLIIVALVAAAGFFIIRKFTLPGVEQFKLIISYLSVLSVILITYSIYFNVTSTTQTANHRLAYDTLEITQRQWISPQDEMQKDFPESFFLFKSMYPDKYFRAEGVALGEPQTYDPLKRQILEMYLSNKIYQAMEDFLSTAKYDLTGSYVWLNIFFMWMQSPILQKNWPSISVCYSQDTRELVGDIIKEANKLIALREQRGEPLTDKDYDDASRKFKYTPR